MKIRVAAVGVTGYSGLELMKVILRHPAMECAAVMASEMTGERPLGEIHPQLRGLSNLVCTPQDPDRQAARVLEPAEVGAPQLPAQRALEDRVGGELDHDRLTRDLLVQ